MLTNECVRDKVEVVFVKSVSSVAVYICDCVLTSLAAPLLRSCSSSTCFILFHLILFQPDKYEYYHNSSHGVDLSFKSSQICFFQTKLLQAIFLMHL